MEGTETLILLEEVLIGKTLDPANSQSKMRSLHLLLTSSPISILRASGVIASRLKSQKKLTEENYEIFSNYLKAIQSGKKPQNLELVHRGFTQDLAHKTFSLIFGFVRIEKISWKTLNWAFKLIKEFIKEKQIGQRKKFFATERVYLILSIAYEKVAKDVFSTLEQGTISKSKFLKQRIKKKVVIKMLKYVTISMETIAYWKWRIKVMDYKENIKILKTGVESANTALECSILANGWKTWTNYISTFKYFKVSLLKRILSNAEIRYFFLKAKIIKQFIIHSKVPARLPIYSQKRKLRSSFNASQLTPKLASLNKLLRIFVIRIKCLLKTSFTRYHFNSLLEETISEIDISKVIRRKRKIIVPSGRSSRASSRKHSRNNSLSKSFRNSPSDALKPIILLGEVRYYYLKSISFTKWRNAVKDESFSQEEYNYVSKRKRVISPRQITYAKVHELEQALENITSRSIFFAGIPKKKRCSILRSTKQQGEDLKLKELVRFLTKTLTARKQMMHKMLSDWSNAGTRYEAKRATKLGIVFTLIKMINSNKKIRGDYFLRWKEPRIGKKIGFEIKESLSVLALMAFKFEFCKKQVFYKFREGLERLGRINRIKLGFRSIFKLYRLLYYQYFATWRENIQKEGNQKILKMLKTLNKAVIFNTQKIFKLVKPKVIPITTAFKLFETLSKLQRSRITNAFKLMPFSSKNKNQVILKKMVKNVLAKFGSRAKKLFRPLRVVKNVDNIKKAALQKMKIKILAVYERFKCKWTMWRLLMEKSNYSEVFRVLKKNQIIFSVQKPLKRIMGKFFFELTLASKAFDSPNFLNLIKKVMEYRLRSYFDIFRPKNLIKSFSFKYILLKVTQKVFRSTFSTLTKPIKFSFLGNSQKSVMSSAFQILKFRVGSFKLLHKCRSAIKFKKILSNIKRNLLQNRFSKWKTVDNIRKKYIMKKFVLNLIFYTSLSEETAMWRWKYNIANNYTVDPKKSIMTKRVWSVTCNYQNRLKQFAFFKLIIFSRLLMSGQLPSPNISFLKPQDLDDTEITYDKSLNQISVSSNLSSKVTKDELLSISRNGAIEILMLNLKFSLVRKLTWGFSCIEYYTNRQQIQETQQDDLIHQLNTLVYDKACLLEDNNSLRTHNEALIESLEQTNDYCNSLSLMINEIQISKMVSNIKKMVEIPLFHVFLTLKLNQESYSSF